MDLHNDCSMETGPVEPVGDVRAALTRETAARRRAEWVARMQAFVVERALDLAVREPDIDGFFGALTQLMVEEGEGCACAYSAAAADDADFHRSLTTFLRS